MHDQYQLFYQAIVEGQEESWTEIYEAFYSQVTWWVRQNKAYWISSEEVNYFANGAFIKFYEAMTPDKFLQVIPNLPTALSYLRACVASVVIDHVRTQVWEEQMEMLDSNPPLVISQCMHELERRIGEHLEAKTLWQSIAQVATDEDEILILQAIFIQGMKSCEILEAYPGRFDSVNQIYRTKEKFIKRLRRRVELWQ